MNELFSYPDEEEMMDAVKICCGRVCRACETPVAYAWRCRNVRMSDLLELAIQNELTDHERKIVRLYFYEEKNMSEIGEIMSISASAVSHALSRARRKLENALKYAALYSCDTTDLSVVPAVTGRARVVSAARLYDAQNFAGKIKKLRLCGSLREEDVEKYAGLRPGRLTAIENGSEPSDGEKLRLCAYFGIMPSWQEGAEDVN